MRFRAGCLYATWLFAIHSFNNSSAPAGVPFADFCVSFLVDFIGFFFLSGESRGRLR
jgi:hypothetical protein